METQRQVDSQGSDSVAYRAFKNPYNCPYCGRRYMTRPMLADGTRNEFYCDCPEFKALEDEERSAREELDRRNRERWRREFVGSIGIPRRYLAIEPDPRLAEDVVRNGGIFMTGNIGAGKTHAACAMLLALYDVPGRPHSARFVNMPNLTRSIRASFGGGRTEEDIMREYETCGVLVIDDLGKEENTAWTIKKLMQLLDNRYYHDLPTVITTQYGWSELGEILSEEVRPDFIEATLSRLSEVCRTMVFDGPDRRTQAR